MPTDDFFISVAQLSQLDQRQWAELIRKLEAKWKPRK